MTVARLIGRAGAIGALVAVGAVLPLSGASAAPYPDGGNPTDVAPTENPLGITLERTDTQPATLPFTGGDVAGLTLLGVAATGAGVVIVRRSRRTA